MKKIVIVGAGFAGLNAALGLEKQFRASSEISITLVDRHDYHLFSPNLYEVATAEEEFTSISQIKKSTTIPFKEILRDKKIQFIQGDFTEWDERGKFIKVGIRKIGYDYLVLALGSRPDFSAVLGAEDYALPFSDLKSAFRIRNALEFAVQSQSHGIQKNNLHFLIAGGGYAAVKLAAEMQSFLDILAWKYGYPREKLETIILEGSDRLVPYLNEEFSGEVLERLTSLGVRSEFHHYLSKVDRSYVEFLNGERWSYEVLIWALGAKAIELPKGPLLPMQGKGQIVIDSFMRVQGKENIFVLGNLAYAYNAKGFPLSQSTAGAIEQGRYVAKVLPMLMSNKKPEPFVSKAKSTMLRLGGKWALWSASKRQLKGYVAYLIEIYFHFVHYRSLLGFWRALKYLFTEVEVFERND